MNTFDVEQAEKEAPVLPTELARLDVYLYDCTGKECRRADADADPIGDAMVSLRNPAAGQWTLVIDAPSVPSGSRATIASTSCSTPCTDDGRGRCAGQAHVGARWSAVERGGQRVGRGRSPRGAHAVLGHLALQADPALLPPSELAVVRVAALPVPPGELIQFSSSAHWLFSGWLMPEPTVCPCAVFTRHSPTRKSKRRRASHAIAAAVKAPVAARASDARRAGPYSSSASPADARGASDGRRST